MRTVPVHARHRRRSASTHDQPAWAPAVKATSTRPHAAAWLLTAVVVALVLGLLIAGALSMLPTGLCSAAALIGSEFGYGRG
ncbi:MAG: hypothetical protein QOJ30_6054 [Pseudonocardiales bacterium]|jgi:hypothetical protein|nr:hypothetical protein [Pseudonocardiales bacterium]